MFNLTAVLETPLGVGGITIESLLFFTLILVIGVLIARIVSINVRRALSERLPVNERELLTKLVYYGIVILAFLAALPQLNVDLSGLLVAGGIAGIVIGFASQSVISNLISG
ncbi:MAG TPA: mechanosensitive ion channel, partial [Methanoculleus sp.]|nr:mechanosensitive ion channel [Methanoculleus sp.]